MGKIRMGLIAHSPTLAEMMTAKIVRNVAILWQIKKKVLSFALSWALMTKTTPIGRRTLQLNYKNLLKHQVQGLSSKLPQPKHKDIQIPRSQRSSVPLYHFAMCICCTLLSVAICVDTNMTRTWCCRLFVQVQWLLQFKDFIQVHVSMEMIL